MTYIPVRKMNIEKPTVVWKDELIQGCKRSSTQMQLDRQPS